MAINLSALAPLTTTATALSNLVLVSPQATKGYQPVVNGQNAPAILFHYEGEQTVCLESDITDHYTEDNTAIQDQIALHPETVTTHGYIGELNDVTPTLLAPLQLAAEKLTIINAYAPALSTTALLAYNEAFQAYQVAQNAIHSAVSAWSALARMGGENVIDSNGLGSSFDPLTGNVQGNQSKQQVAFQQFYGYWRSRTLFTVQTPWAIFKNMAIKTLRAIQDAETNVITDFEVTFKMMRFASTQSTSASTSLQKSGRAATQSFTGVYHGPTAPTPSFALGTKLK